MGTKLRRENGRFVSDATPEEREAFRRNARSFKTAPSAMPSRSSAAGEKEAWNDLETDMDSYKRLRDDGLQPPSIRGSADLESRAETKMEVESGQIVEDKTTRDQVEKVIKESKDSGT
tara:strand:+ start:12409 stop:12762 length:354 start_codon:yes stop_codon:yes gene_type:complete